MAKKKQDLGLKKPVTFSMSSVLLFIIAFGVVGVYVVWGAFAARAPSGTCQYSSAPNGGVVAATGLPTDKVINFFTHDNVTGDQSGWVLGITHDGTFSSNVPAPTHTTTYDFVSKTWGKNGSKYNIYAECTQSV
jgi:hypothetical protein